MKYYFLASAIFFLSFGNVYAISQPTVSPHVIDLKGKPRETPSATITITDTEPSNHTVYGFDSLIGEATGTNYASTFMRWIRYPHTIEFKGAGKKDLTLTVEIPPDAQKGIYHAAIRFAADNFQNEAAITAQKQNPLLLSVEVLDSGIELLQLQGFGATKNYFPSAPATLRFMLENTGTKPLEVAGSVRIYNKTGTEIQSIPVAPVSLNAKEKKSQEIVWKGPATTGRYKAFLNLKYGEAGERTITDTTFFWILDIRKIILLFIIGLIAVVSLTYMLHRRHLRVQ